MHTPTVFSGERLTIYLNDHLAGATAGAELAARVASENKGTAMQGPLERLSNEIRKDREELIAIMSDLDVPLDRAKVVLGWAVEKIGRLKPNGQLVGYSPLARVLELEGLLGGIQAKQALWRALLHADLVDRDALERLIGRARAQITTVQRLHRTATVLLFAPDANHTSSI
jgi:hypothetical protein